MKILFSTDFHSNFSRLYLLASKADLCICCGDLFDYHEHPTIDFKFPLPFYSIKGNKELWGGEKINRILKKCHNFFWLNEHLDDLVELTGLHFYGIDHRHEPSFIPQNTDILIAHQPAYGLADECKDPFRKEIIAHCGSKAIRRLVDRFRPKLLVAGHVHQFQQQQLGKIQAITLAAALKNPVLMLAGKKIELLE